MKMSDLEKVIQKVSYHPHGDHIGNIYVEVGVDEKDPDKDTGILISPGCLLDCTGNIRIGRWVYIAAGVRIWTHTHDIYDIEILLKRRDRLGRDFTIPMDKIIGEDVWIYESTILPSCRNIANGVVIGAGSIVTKSIDEAYSIWGGNPAGRIGSRKKKDKFSGI